MPPPHLPDQGPAGRLLHHNSVIASGQLLVWLLFIPSYWRRFISTIDPALAPDCTLVDIGWTPQHAPLRRQLFNVYKVYLPIIALVSAVICKAYGSTGDLFLAGVLAPLTIAVFYFLLAGTWISVAVGIILSVPGSLSFGLVYIILGGLGVPFDIPQSVAPLFGALYGAIIGLSGGLAGVVASNITPEQPSYALGRWSTAIVGVGGGVLIGAVSIYTLHSLMQFMVHLTIQPDTLGGQSHILLPAIAFLLALGLYVVLVGWSRARSVLAISMFSLLCILVGFVVSGWFGFVRGATIGVSVGFIALIGLPFTVVNGLAGARVAAGATALGFGVGWIVWGANVYRWEGWPTIPLSLASVVAGATLSWWYAPIAHPLLEIWNLLVMHFDERRAPGKSSLLRWHAAFWHETHRVPFRTLDTYLVFISDRNALEGQAAIEFLSNNRHQHVATQAAQIELYARHLERVQSVDELASALQALMAGELDSPVSSILRSFSRIGQTVSAALNSTTVYHKRLALNTADERLDALLREMIVSNDRYARRFRPVVAHWRRIIAGYLNALNTTGESAQELDNPYIFGLPLAETHELFVGRADIAARIEQLIVDRRRPPLLLYGQRRMGKTSLLRNLGRMLPSNTVLLFVDGEGVSSANDFSDLLYVTAMAMVKSADQYRHVSLPPANRDAIAANPFTAFNEWLDQVEQVLDQAQMVALLALDEFEALESTMHKGRFDAIDLMRLLRNLIQHRQRFKVLLAGSHTLDELRYWASQLINVQVVKISYLEETDVLKLIEQPVTNFALHYDPAASRHILSLTRGHPHLVQLLCYEIVDLKNQQPVEQRFFVTVEDVEAAVPAALQAGDFFFADLANQVGPVGRALLNDIAIYGYGVSQSRALGMPYDAAEADEALTLLMRRDVLEHTPDGYRFQVELIRRWFINSAPQHQRRNVIGTSAHAPGGVSNQ